MGWSYPSLVITYSVQIPHWFPDMMYDSDIICLCLQNSAASILPHIWSVYLKPFHYGTIIWFCVKSSIFTMVFLSLLEMLTYLFNFANIFIRAVIY